MLNNCFIIAAKVWQKDKDKPLKVPMYFNEKGKAKKVYGGADHEEMGRYYRMSYDEACSALHDYMMGSPEKGSDSLRISLHLAKARYNDLSLFVIDFDKYDTESDFFKTAYKLANKVTRSQGGGYHMFYGVDKAKATPLFDSINLLASKTAKGFVSKNSFDISGSNQVDLFCEAYQLMYEWEEWDNSLVITDQTTAIYELIRDNFNLTRPVEFDVDEGAEYDGIWLEGRSEQELLADMNDLQKVVFEDLKTISADCDRAEWFSIGVNICNVFDEELGGCVFLWWSKHGQSFQPQGCAKTWINIMKKCRKDGTLNNHYWAEIMGLEVNAFDIEIPSIKKPLKANMTKKQIQEYNKAMIASYGNKYEKEKEPEEKKEPIKISGCAAEWGVTTKEIKKVFKNACGEDVEETTIKEVLRVKYGDNFYTLRELFVETFPDFRKYNKKVTFKHEDIARIGQSQRRRATYHYMESRFPLVEVEEEYGESIVRLINDAPGTKTQVEQAILNYNKKLNGVERLLTFGVLPVQDDTAKLWCYTPYYYPNHIVYQSEPLTWEDWHRGILKVIGQTDIEEIYIAVSCQNGVYLTLPIQMREAINTWIANYRGRVAFDDISFPYSGPINHGEDYSFTIDFDTDCVVSEIGAGSLRAAGAMAAYNKANAAEQSARKIKEYGKIESFPSDGEWTMKELEVFGFNTKNIEAYFKSGLLTRRKLGRGYAYTKVIV